MNIKQVRTVILCYLHQCDGTTALHRAVHLSATSVVKLLVRLGADRHVTDSVSVYIMF